MSVTQNLIRAEAAVKFVESRLRGRASNKPEDIAHALQQNLRTKYAGKAYAGEAIILGLEGASAGPAMSEIYQKRWREIADARSTRESTGRRFDSAAIIADGVGNCFEHAVLACRYLNGIGIPSYLVETDDETDHVFVLLGLPGGLGGKTYALETRKHPGPPVDDPFCVVCDAWYHEWFGVQQEWSVKMKRILLTTNKRSDKLLPAKIPFKLTDGGLVT